MTNYSLLSTTLSAAVPLHIAEIRKHGQTEWIHTLQTQREIWLQVISEQGDNILFRSKKSGETAKAFNVLVKALAHMAFIPGGIKFLEEHWEETW